MTTLAGKSYYGDTVGQILISGKERPLSDFKRVVGFVPQEDIMMRDLTVKENIWFSAQTRLPSNWTTKRKKQYRDATIEVLGLREIRHSPIGDENTRGISGGQRKRVNIALEMVADPLVLFLDEPTSGLDSTSSMEVCSALRKIADIGITVVTVLHQPRCRNLHTVSRCTVALEKVVELYIWVLQSKPSLTLNTTIFSAQTRSTLLTS